MTEEKYYKPCSTCHNVDCVWMGGKDTHKKCEDYQALDQEPCEDVISRQASIDFINNHLPFRTSNEVYDAYADCVRMLGDNKALPPVNPQPKTGHWTNNVNGTYTCDHCGCKHSKSNYCPNCGCKMESEGKE